MRKNIVLIDFESVQPASLSVLAADHFRLKVFVGAMQNKVPFDLVTAIQRMGERAEYIKIAGNGPNALDFHIAYYIGRISCDESDAFFHIISKDTGFDPLIQHLKDQKIFCGRWPTLEEIPAIKAMHLKTPDERARAFLGRLQQPNATKPRTEKTLRSSVAAHFQKQITDSEVSAVINALHALGHLSITAGKVIYLNTN
ncbi:PIN domain-containing protein [Massilia suwonensis]|uniref:PIN domain-containing protein n=1 Tax=Massilia suwonensis TaxID=648895 RepID=A0ABW0MHV1_9BURK